MFRLVLVSPLGLVSLMMLVSLMVNICHTGIGELHPERLGWAITIRLIDASVNFAYWERAGQPPTVTWTLTNPTSTRRVPRS